MRRHRLIAIWNPPPAYFTNIPPQEIEEFVRISYTIGGLIVFPSDQVEGKWTINQARGMLATIKDRFDLTLECVRRFYLKQSSPMDAVFDRYSSFFELFLDFRGYVDFFFLQDLVDAEYQSIRFFLPFADFTGSAVAETHEEFTTYRARSVQFIESRNARIAASMRG